MAHGVDDAHVAAFPVLVMDEPSAVLHPVPIAAEGFDVQRLPVLIGEVEVTLHLAEMDGFLFMFRHIRNSTAPMQAPII